MHLYIYLCLKSADRVQAMSARHAGIRPQVVACTPQLVHMHAGARSRERMQHFMTIAGVSEDLGDAEILEELEDIQKEVNCCLD
mmetsp:Transcript_29075/g.75226  ORF Transcript_29075/g.75226 Transcript_29075/m.75226 type:complete len:84 (-) Transcript_29075:1207-1458(-)